MARISQTPKSQLFAGAGYNLFEAHSRPQQQQRQFEEETTFLDEAAMADAAEAIRETEIEAVDSRAAEPAAAHPDREQLQHMNIDELRIVAKLLDVHDREQITDRNELIAAIERSL